MVTLEFKVITGLEVDPKTIGGPKDPREPQRGIRTDPTLTVDDLINPSGWDPDRNRETVLGNAERLQEVQKQDFARVYRCNCGWHINSFQW